jgi:predicted nucleotidyltransferase component of viral defense system
MLDRIKHETVLKSILRDVYQDDILKTSLGFKGGTCLYIFYNLDRFSVDLDFNITNDNFDPNKVTTIVKQCLSIEEQEKRNTWFWLGSYEKGKQKVKIEISKRDYPDRYINLNFYGLTIPTMTPDCMFAHKLCAISDRKKLLSRDLYDAHFMFKNRHKSGFEINEEIIKIRTGKTSKEYCEFLIPFIEKEVHPRTILEGIGELISEKQKIWVKNYLIRDLIIELKIYTGIKN